MENRCVPSPAMTRITRTAGRKIADFRAHPVDTAMISVYGDAARLDVGANEGHGTFEGGARPEDLGPPQRLQGGNILPGDGPAQNNQNIARTPLLEQPQDPRNNHVVRTGENAQPDTVDILLQGGIDD